MAKIWLISDTHFGHEAMYKFTDEHGKRIRWMFENAKQGDEYMLDMWNQTVKPPDHVYHLGDVAMDTHYLHLCNKLNGELRLILGNHDHWKMALYMSVGFKKIFGSRQISKALLTHIPLHPGSIPQWCVGNIHGHIHAQASPPGKYFNVSVERINYCPIDLEAVLVALTAL